MIGIDPPISRPDRVSLTCPLGLRFLDVATGALVCDGLRATAWPAGIPNRKRDSRTNPSGIHGFHGLAGLRSFENSLAGDPWRPPPKGRVFHILVFDGAQRFLPCTFAVSAPAEGIATFGDAESPPEFEHGAVPLFSTPWRVAPGSVAVVRGELRDASADKPAAWAVMEAAYSSGGVQRTALGLADAMGRAVLFFPYPEGQARSFGASPPSGGRRLSEQEWPLRMRFFYNSIEEPETAADYAFRLWQRPIDAWRGASPLAPLLSETLTFGREVNLGIVYLGHA